MNRLAVSGGPIEPSRRVLGRPWGGPGQPDNAQGSLVEAQKGRAAAAKYIVLPLLLVLVLVVVFSRFLIGLICAAMVVVKMMGHFSFLVVAQRGHFQFQIPWVGPWVRVATTVTTTTPVLLWLLSVAAIWQRWKIVLKHVLIYSRKALCAIVSLQCIVTAIAIHPVIFIILTMVTLEWPSLPSLLSSLISLLPCSKTWFEYIEEGRIFGIAQVNFCFVVHVNFRDVDLLLMLRGPCLEGHHAHSNKVGVWRVALPIPAPASWRQ